MKRPTKKLKVMLTYLTETFADGYIWWYDSSIANNIKRLNRKVSPFMLFISAVVLL